jgi:stage II sporulation protein D
VSLEDYLRSVVPSEMPASWPLDALMAQAVAARTYALYRLGAKGYAKPWLTSADMAYKGAMAESPLTDRAVALTRDMVLTYRADIFPAFFHSSCGGATSSAASVFGDSACPVRGVKCGWCSDSPYSHWVAYMSLSELAAKLSPWCSGRLETPVPVGRDEAGRVQSMLINRTERVRAADFRWAVGPNVLRSTAFTIEKRDGGLEFIGRGWGHGVGLCQWGARGMARAGRDWRRILSYDYRGTRLARVREE